MTNFNHNTFTGGSVTIEDGLKAKEEYAPARKVSITLNYSTPEDGDGVALLDYVIAVAQGRQAALLFSKAPTQVAAPAPVAEAPKPETAAARKKREAAEAAAAEAAKPQRTKADLEREMLTAAGAKPEADELEEEPAASTAPATEKDELADLLGDTAPAPVTDAELGKAAQEKNGDMKGKTGWAPEKIRELVGKFVLVGGKPKPGAKLQEIPAAQRHDFLAKLKALK